MNGFWVTLLGLPFCIQWVSQNLLPLYIYLLLLLWQGYWLDILSGSISSVPLASENRVLTSSGSQNQLHNHQQLCNACQLTRGAAGKGSCLLSWDNIFPHSFDPEKTAVHYLAVCCHHLSSPVMCFHPLASSFSTCPLKHWWDIFFHHLLQLVWGWARVSPATQGPVFLHLLVWFGMHASSQQTRTVYFTKKYDFIYYKPL